jgi:hypothetical protein
VAPRRSSASHMPAWICSSSESMRCFITGCPLRVFLRIMFVLLCRTAAAFALPLSLSSLSASRCTPPVRYISTMCAVVNILLLLGGTG